MKSYPWYVWLASVFGLGFIPSGMPGTVSSAFACVVSIFVDVPLWAIVLVAHSLPTPQRLYHSGVLHVQADRHTQALACLCNGEVTGRLGNNGR